MAGSSDASSGYDSAARRRLQDARGTDSRYGDTDASGAEGDGGEDLFLNLAEDNSIRDTTPNITMRSDRVRSRIARSNRQSLPSSIPSSSPATSNLTRSNGARIPAAIDTQTGTQYRRSSLVPSSTRSTREQTPITPANPVETPRTRLHELSPQRSFVSRPKDSDLSPKEFLAQLDASRKDKRPSYAESPQEFIAKADATRRRPKDTDFSPKDFLAQLDTSRRRPSYPDALQTPPNRTGTFKPSNLHYHSSSRETPATPHVDTPQEARSRYEGTESHGSTGPATSMWDELDELKSRMKRLEMGGKIPATSGAIVAQASAERPQTANTSITTVSSSPNQQRKAPSSESIVLASASSKVHPLLGEALAKAKKHTAPAIYRVLEATASEALALAEMTGSAGPQGTFHSASSILGGPSVPDRQVRRKADNIDAICLEEELDRGKLPAWTQRKP
ncbi:hypothetical protein N0V90_000067 [Kalmusia sp. IMI 367209]|nr:hypothetical protein N0V90_000067 [Kalmusia sp. IMI 367209]